MSTQTQAKKDNIFARIGRGTARFFSKLFTSIADGFCAFGKRFKDGSKGTKASHFVMGAGNIYHGQYAKGILFALVGALYLAFMIVSPQISNTPLGLKAIANLADLGYTGGVGGGLDPVTGMPIVVGNSMLMLLFGVITIGVTILVMVVYFANISSSYKADLDARCGKRPTTFRQDLAEMLDGRFHITMLSPTVLGVTLFTVLPTIYMILIAFTGYAGANATGQPNFGWDGLQHFAEIFEGNNEIGERFLPVVGWTIVWAFFATFTNYFGGILLAVLINRKGIKGKIFFRTVFIMTIAIPQFISLLAMRNLLSANGPVNGMLMNLGWIDTPINFLGHDQANQNITLIRFMIILVNMWVGVPYTMLMTSGILMNVPADLFEAARVDGAKPLTIFFKITFPYIFFITTPYLISSFIGNITSFNIIFMLSGGGPAVAGYKAGQTDLLVTWLYKLTIDNNLYNQGAVIGILTFVCTSIITLVTYRRSKSYKEEDTFQ